MWSDFGLILDDLLDYPILIFIYLYFCDTPYSSAVWWPARSLLEIGCPCFLWNTVTAWPYWLINLQGHGHSVNQCQAPRDRGRKLESFESRCSCLTIAICLPQSLHPRMGEGKNNKAVRFLTSYNKYLAQYLSVKPVFQGKESYLPKYWIPF